MTDNPFRMFWDLGYRRIIPVLPPDATISPKSNLTEDARGKSPAAINDDGTWHGIDMFRIEAQERDLDIWNSWGANLGLRGAGEDGLFFVDVDHMDAKAARRIYDIAKDTMGLSFPRVGQSPKFAMPYRLAAGEIKSIAVKFDGEVPAGGKRPGLDIIYDRPHMVAWGIHPKTGQPYSWKGGKPPHIDEIPRVDATQVHDFLEAVLKEFPAKSRSESSDEGEAVDPERLKAPDLETLRQAMLRFQNDDRYAGRQEWVQVAQALIGACGWENREEAFEMFDEFSSRWTDGHNDPDHVRTEFNKVKPSRLLGYTWLVDQQPEAFARLFFEPVARMSDLATDMFGEEEGQRRVQEGIRLLTLDEIMDLPDPRFLVDRYIPEEGFGLLFGDPGSGKSFLALDLALHLAYGLPDYHGDAIRAEDRGAVLYIAGEGAPGFRKRIRAWQAHNLTPERQQTAKHLSAPAFRLVHQPINFMKPEDIGRLADAVKAAGLTRLSMIVVDTVSRAIPGADENLQKDMTIFVAACDALRHATGAFVLGVHHTSKAGEMRGSSVFLGQADMVLRLTRKKGSSVGRLTCDKQKDAPDGWHDAYRFEEHEAPDGLASLVPVRVDAAEEHEVESIRPSVQDQMLDIIAAAWDRGEALSMKAQAKDRYVLRVLARDLDVRADAVEAAVGMWLAQGLIDEREYRDSNGRPRVGLCVVGRIVRDGASDEEGGGIFG